MDFGKEKKHTIDFLFVITLFFVFSISSLLLIVFGAKIYQNTVEKMQSNYQERTSLAYISEKIKQHDAHNAVTIETYQGIDSLVLSETIGESTYYTYIYYYDGYIRELLTADPGDLGPNAGNKIIEATDFFIKEEQNNLYQIIIGLDDNISVSLFVCTHCN